MTWAASAVLLRHEVLRQLPVVELPPWRRNGYAVVPILIPTRHARVGPDHVAALLVNQLVVTIMHVRAYFERGVSILNHLAERQGDVPNLTLGMKNDAAAMCKIGVRAISKEQVGKARHGDPEIGPRVIVAPDAADRPASASPDVHRPQHLGCVK